jgi:thiamine-phosphate pyrophosphorylase
MKLELSKPVLILITDRKANEQQNLLDLIQRAARAGVDLIQIREKDLPARELCRLVEQAVVLTSHSGARILVNDRFDVALSCGAHGVHLTTQSLPTEVVRKTVGDEFLIGVSTHSKEEAERAEAERADFIVLGSVFETPSKRQYGPPLGLSAFAEIASGIKIPVIAIGGINLHNFHQALDAGAAGIAAIRLFAEAESIEEIVRLVKAFRRRNAE